MASVTASPLAMLAVRHFLDDLPLPRLLPVVLWNSKQVSDRFVLILSGLAREPMGLRTGRT